MEKENIAPCGMNCGVCVRYLTIRESSGKLEHTCLGCRPRKRHCFLMKSMKGKCPLPSGEANYCFQCQYYPCRALLRLDERYREKYQMSMIENLNFVKKLGIEKFLENEEKKWSCPEGILCVHNKQCYKVCD